jgi:hypothetical protein
MIPAEELLLLTIKNGKTERERQRIRSLYAEVGDRRALEISVDNKLTPMMAHGLLEGVGEANLPSHWALTHRGTEERVTACLDEVDRLSLLLEAHGIRSVIMENGGIARFVAPCRGCFASNDFEILVDKSKVPLVEEILLREGLGRDPRMRTMWGNTQQSDFYGWHVYHQRLNNGIEFRVNVMWKPLLRRWMPSPFQLSAADLLSLSVAVPNPRTALRVLPPALYLLLCSLHTASHSYVRGPGLRLQLDVDHLVRRTAIDWEWFMSLAMEQGVRTVVFPSLAIPAGLLGTPVPQYVLERLVPSSEKQQLILNLLRRASVFNRGSRKFAPKDFLWLEANLSDSGVAQGALRVFFPPAQWMLEGYPGSPHWALPWLYAHRLEDLARRRYG